MSKLLVKNIGRLQTPVGSFPHCGEKQGENLKLDNAAVYAEDGIIKAISSAGEMPVNEEDMDTVIDAEGRLADTGRMKFR